MSSDKSLMQQLTDALAQIKELESFKRAYQEVLSREEQKEAQIKDYESALEEITKSNFGTRGNVLAQQALNKWRAK